MNEFAEAGRAYFDDTFDVDPGGGRQEPEAGAAPRASGCPTLGERFAAQERVRRGLRGGGAARLRGRAGREGGPADQRHPHGRDRLHQGRVALRDPRLPGPRPGGHAAAGRGSLPCSARRQHGCQHPSPHDARKPPRCAAAPSAWRGYAELRQQEAARRVADCIALARRCPPGMPAISRGAARTGGERREAGTRPARLPSARTTRAHQALERPGERLALPGLRIAEVVAARAARDGRIARRRGAPPQRRTGPSSSGGAGGPATDAWRPIAGPGEPDHLRRARTATSRRSRARTSPSRAAGRTRTTRCAVRTEMPAPGHAAGSPAGDARHGARSARGRSASSRQNWRSARPRLRAAARGAVATTVSAWLALRSSCTTQRAVERQRQDGARRQHHVLAGLREHAAGAARQHADDGALLAADHRAQHGAQHGAHARLPGLVAPVDVLLDRDDARRMSVRVRSSR